jgi:hypothetical protein
MAQPVSTPTTYRFLTERSGSSYRELFVCGTSLRGQSLECPRKPQRPLPSGSGDHPMTDCTWQDVGEQTNG